MNVVHFTQMAPNQSGMYESTKDQIKYERREGLESDIIDPLQPDNAGKKDDWLEGLHWEKAKDIEVWVIHAGLPPPLKDYLEEGRNKEKHSVVAILHGPVEHMLFKEYTAAMRNIHEDRSFTEVHINMIWNYDACVVINQHEYDISKLYDENDRLCYIPNSIDLERIDIEASSWPYVQRPAIIVADYPRFEKTPAHIIFAMPRVIEKLPEARLSVLALPFENIEFWRNIFHRSTNWHLLKKCVDNLHIKGGPIIPYIRGADIMFNSNFSGILSRVGMEAMALGVPIVSYNGDYTEYHAKTFDLDSIAQQIEQCWHDLSYSEGKLREKTIEYAHNNFNRAVYVKEYVKLYEKLREGKNA